MNARWQTNPRPSGAVQAVMLLVAILGSVHNESDDDKDTDT